MEIKEMSLLTKEEKVELLNHWLMYYGKTPIGLLEHEGMKELIDERTDDVMRVAFLNSLINEGSTSFIKAFRTDKVQELFGMAEQIFSEASADSDMVSHMKILEDEFIENIIGTYNNPEPPVAMPIEQILRELFGVEIVRVEINRPTAQETMSDKVDRIFGDCCFYDSELENGEPIVPYVLTDSVMAGVVFNAARLNEHRDEIAELIDNLPEFGDGINFTELSRNRMGRVWANSFVNIDQLLALGIASGFLDFTVPKELWQEMGVEPVIKKNVEALAVVGHNPECYAEERRQFLKRFERKTGDE